MLAIDIVDRTASAVAGPRGQVSTYYVPDVQLFPRDARHVRQNLIAVLALADIDGDGALEGAGR